MNRIWSSVVAEFKQRTRQQSYIVTLLAMAMLTMLFFPAPEAHYQTLVINGYRGIYNSDWIGICLAMLNVMLLPLICFYLIKNAIELDRRSKTCELIAATPVSKQTYLFGKWVVNVFILISIVLVMLMTSVLVQLYYGESYHIDIWAFAWPQLAFVVPVLFAIASVALLFESVRWLRGSMGNVVYFFIWVGSIAQSITSVSGIGALLEQLDRDVVARFPSASGSTNVGIALSNESNQVKSFVWEGAEPVAGHLFEALPFLLISGICFVAAVLLFDRFSSTDEEREKTSKLAESAWVKRTSATVDALFTNITGHFKFTQLIYLESKLLFKGHSVYWFIGLAVLNMMQLFMPQASVVNFVLPFAWLWCVLVVSQLGQFEKQSGAVELITYSQRSAISQSLASFLAGLFVLVIASVGGITRFVLTGEWVLLLQLAIAISFTVAFAFIAGTLSGSKRLFEALYLVLVYMGPLQLALYLDFFGVNGAASWQANMPQIYAGITALMLMSTLFIRARN